MQPLSPRRARFVQEYLIDLNPLAAAERAGYARTAGNHYAHTLLRKPEVAAAVRTAMAARARRLQLSADRVVQELMAVAFSDIRRIVSWRSEPPRKRPQGGGTPGDLRLVTELRGSEEIDDGSAAAIASWRRTVDGQAFIRLYDKVPVLALLGRHLGMFGFGLSGWATLRAKAATGGAPATDEAMEAWQAEVLDALSPQARAELRAAILGTVRGKGGRERRGGGAGAAETARPGDRGAEGGD